MNKKIAPSIVCCDLINLKEQLDIFKKSGVELLHFDVMDGDFVPNFALGPDVAKAIKAYTDIPLDIHLMVNNPEKTLSLFTVGEGDIISIHYESSKHVQRALAEVKRMGAKAFIALNPATPVTVLENVLDDIDGVLVMTVNPGFAGQKLIPATIDKIKRVREYLDANGKTDVEIEADGNVSLENAVKMNNAGANIFVAGTSSIFKKDVEVEEGINHLRAKIN